MHRRRIFLPIVFLFLILSILVYLLATQGTFNFPNAVTQKFLSPLQGVLLVPFQSPFIKPSSLQQLQKENEALRQQLVQQKLLESDNQALRDQFVTTNPSANTMIPAHIIGEPSFIPGVSAPDTVILDKGSSDNVQIGQAVVYKDSAIGKITKVNQYFSLVTLITTKNFAINAQTVTGAIGISRGEGNNELVLDNVLLAQHLHIGDMVVTKGDIDISGKGYPHGLIIGKIAAVDHDPSALFQKAQVVSLADITKLGMVFIIIK